MRLFYNILLLFCLCLGADAQTITDFRFSSANLGWTSDLTGVIDNDAKTVTFSTQKWIENIAALPATFTLDGDYDIHVNGIEQISGVSPNDFRKDVIYTVNGGVNYTVRFESPQASGLPVIKIDTKDGKGISDRENYVNMTFSLTDADNPENNIVVVNTENGIRGRGHSSWAYRKKPYRIKFDKKTSLFGLEAAKSWVLLAEFLDPTLIKNNVAFELGDRFSLPYNHSYQHVQLYLNGNYQGLYGLTEQTQVNPGRVDIDDKKGWLVEMDFHTDGELRFETENYNMPVKIKSPEIEPVEIDNPAYDFVIKDVNELCDFLISTNFPENGYRDLIDMETFINYIMVPVIIGYADFNNPGSVYMYRDKNKKISMGPLWDYDITFGFAWESIPLYTINSDVAYYPAKSNPIPRNPFFNRFFQDPVFLMKWKEYWNDRYSGEITSMMSFIDDVAAKINKGAKENYKLWNSTWWANYYPLFNYSIDFDEQIGIMKDYYNARIDYLNEQYNKVEVLPERKTFATQPAGYSEIAPQSVTVVALGEITNLSASLLKNESSNFEITDISVTSAGNGGYFATIKIKPKNSLAAVETYTDRLILSGNNQGNSFSFEVPITFAVKRIPDFTVPTGLTATFGELLSSVELPDGWEWESAGTTRVGDVGTQTHKATFTPENTNSYIVVTGIDVEINVVQSSEPLQKIFVNEINGNDKWIEIYSDEEEDVDISGYVIRKTDNVGVIANWTIPSGTIIAAKGFLTWTQGTNLNETFTWGISAQRDVTFKLFDNKGRELDNFEVKMSDNLYSQGNNRTVGRQTDGHPNLIVFLDGGTKGYSNNEGTAEKPAEGEGKRIYVNEISGNAKWLEIYNDEDEDVDISDYVIRKIDDVNEAVNWTIPSGTIIAAKGFRTWTQNVDDGFTWGITAQRDVAFKLFDDKGRELDYFEVKMSDGLYSQDYNRTVGRQTDGNPNLVIFLNGGTKGISNSFGIMKADYDMSGVVFADKTVTYNGEAHSILVSSLPNGVTVLEYIGNDKTDVGTYIVTVKFAVVNPVNFNIPKDMTATLIIEAVTSVEEPDVSQITLYPNPNDGHFNINFAEHETYRISIVNLAGQILKREIVAGQNAQMDISGYPNGVYLLIVETGKRIMTIKIVKQ